MQTIIEGKTFEDDMVDLDGNDFVGCRLIRCQLIFRGKQPFSYTSTEITGCRFVFVEHAEIVAYVIASLLRNADMRAEILQLLNDLPRRHPLAN